MSRVVVFGGYGTFGRLVVQALVERGMEVTIAGRDFTRAETFAAQLQPVQWAARADLNDAASCRQAIVGHAVGVNCAGPFNRLGATWLEACLAERCHAVDIADDRGYAALVRSLGDRFKEENLAAVTGCSSLPGLSGALALVAREQAAAPIDRAAVSLFIGNANPKGRAAVESLLRSLGKSIAAPQGPLRVFGGRAVVPLPAPFGQRSVYHFESPEYDLFPQFLGAHTVTVRVGFELGPANVLFAMLARLPLRYGARTAAWLEHLSRPFGKLGHSGGAVLVELFSADGSICRASISASEGGQRMAALPCALAAEAVARGTVEAAGALNAYELLGARGLLDQMQAAGFAFDCRIEPASDAT